VNKALVGSSTSQISDNRRTIWELKNTTKDRVGGGGGGEGFRSENWKHGKTPNFRVEASKGKEKN